MKDKILVAYFAQKGHENDSTCSIIANRLGELLKAKGEEYDIFAIVPTEEYPADEPNFTMAVKAEQEQRHRPELVGKYSGMKYVSRILLVAPNWFGDMPMAVYSFFDDYDFAEKRIVPVIACAGDKGNYATQTIDRFLHKDWVLPSVYVPDNEARTADLSRAIDELFRQSSDRG